MSGGGDGSDTFDWGTEGALDATATLGWAGPGDPTAGAAPSLPDRYEDLGVMAAGSMGTVHRVRDRVLQRVLAMKVLRWDLVEREVSRARFLREAEITAQLQHPGIVALHDRGQFEDGRLWFTMKEVRGRTLLEVIEEVHAACRDGEWRPGPSGITFRRLVVAFGQVCQAVAYAHSRGVVHRDLKPENIMVGEFGEVQVMDWGIALLLDPLDRTRDPVSTSEPSDLEARGRIAGTPVYMPPEQARGDLDAMGPTADVYALGVVLYQLLTGRAPWSGSARSVWKRLLDEAPPAPELVVGPLHPPMPEELLTLCRRAMSRDPALRPRHAGVLATEVESWLDGALRRDRALALVREADDLSPRVTALRAEARALRQRADGILSGLRPHDAVDRKRPAWELQDRASSMEQEASVQETVYVQRLNAALNWVRDLPEARRRLADYYQRRMVDAESRHDADASRFEVLLRAHAGPSHTAFLDGRGRLTLVTDPAGASATLYRYERSGRRLVPTHVGEIGPTPLLEVPLDRGSYLVRLRAPGREDVSYPIFLPRSGHWDGARPGSADPHPVVLPPAGTLGTDDLHVPAGWFQCGGDPDAADGLPARRLWLDAFVMRRHPVTVGEYLAFLDDLVGRGREDLALRHVPREGRGVAGTEDRPLFRLGDDGRFAQVPDAHGDVFDRRSPVTRVDWADAVAWAAWLAERTGQPWRLPHDMEWEKAARGVDGRILPWGDWFDPTWACVLESHAGEPRLVPVDAFPVDVSPYGVRGLAGNVRDWCGNGYRREGPDAPDGVVRVARDLEEPGEYRMVRGGAWSSVALRGHAAARHANRPQDRFSAIGFRVVRSFPG